MLNRTQRKVERKKPTLLFLIGASIKKFLNRKAVYSEDYSNPSLRNVPKPVLSTFDNDVIISERLCLQSLSEIYGVKLL